MPACHLTNSVKTLTVLLLLNDAKTLNQDHLIYTGNCGACQKSTIQENFHIFQKLLKASSQNFAPLITLLYKCICTKFRFNIHNNTDKIMLL